MAWGGGGGWCSGRFPRRPRAAPHTHAYEQLEVWVSDVGAGWAGCGGVLLGCSRWCRSGRAGLWKRTAAFGRCAGGGRRAVDQPAEPVGAANRRVCGHARPMRRGRRPSVAAAAATPHRHERAICAAGSTHKNPHVPGLKYLGGGGRPVESSGWGGGERSAGARLFSSPARTTGARVVCVGCCVLGDVA